MEKQKEVEELAGYLEFGLGFIADVLMPCINMPIEEVKEAKLDEVAEQYREEVIAAFKDDKPGLESATLIITRLVKFSCRRALQRAKRMEMSTFKLDLIPLVQAEFLSRSLAACKQNEIAQVFELIFGKQEPQSYCSSTTLQ